MATKGTPVTHDEIVEKDVFQNTIEQAVALRIELTKLVGGFKQLAAITGKKISAIDPKNITEAQQLAKTYVDINTIQKGYNETQKQLIYNKEKIRILIKQETDAQKANAQVQNAAKGSVAEMRAELKKLTIEWANLADVEGQNAGKFKELSSQKLELTNKLKGLEGATGDHRREVGNYGKALGGLQKVLISVAESMGVNQEFVESLKENHKLLKEAVHGSHQALHNLGMAHKAEAVAATEEAAAEKVATAAKLGAIPVIGLVIAGLVALGAAIYAYIQVQKEAQIEEAERSRAIDGTIIKDKELRDSYNEHALAVAKLADGYKVLRGEITQYQADLNEVARKTQNEVINALNEGNEKVQEARKHSFTDYLRDLAYYTGGIFYGMDSGIQKAAKRAEEEEYKKQEKIKNAIAKGNVEAQNLKLEKEKKDKEDADAKAKEEAKKRKEAYDKELADLKKHLELMKKLQYEEEVDLRRLREQAAEDKDKKIYDDMKKWRDAKIAETNIAIEQLQIHMKKEEDLRKERLNRAIAEQEMIVNATQQALARQIDLKKKAFSYEQSLIDSQIQIQTALAARGYDNQLDYALKKKAENIEAQKLLDKKAARQQEALQLVNIYLEFMKTYAKDPGGAGKALAQTLVAKGIAAAIAGSFKDGVEGLDGQGTETSDSNLALLSKGESVVTAKGTKDNPGLATAMNSGKVEEYFRNIYEPKFSEYQDKGRNQLATEGVLAVLNDKLSNIEEAVKKQRQFWIEKNVLDQIIYNDQQNGILTKTSRERNPIVQRDTYNKKK